MENAGGKDDKKTSKNFWVIMGIALLTLIIGGITFYNLNIKNPDSKIGQVLNSPSEFYSKDAKLTGEIDQIIGMQSFTIDAPEPFSDQLLVISKEPLQPIGGSGPDDFLYDTGDRVSVKGKIMQFNIRQIENELGTELVDEEFRIYNGRPVIIADSIETEI